MQLSRFQVELLKLLFEAGGENIPTLINTLANTLQLNNTTLPSRAALLTHFDDAVEQLRQQGFIGLMYYLADQQPAWRYLTEAELRHVTPASACLEWDESASSWRWDEKRRGKERVVVVIEDAGKKQLVEQERLKMG